MIIYRGYDIDQDADSKWYVSVAKERCDGFGGGFDTEEAAMDAIDARRRSRVQAGLDPVGV